MAAWWEKCDRLPRNTIISVTDNDTLQTPYNIYTDIIATLFLQIIMYNYALCNNFPFKCSNGLNECLDAGHRTAENERYMQCQHRFNV